MERTDIKRSNTTVDNADSIDALREEIEELVLATCSG
jgi:hypothetical protein